MTNVIAFLKFQAKGVYFDDRNIKLYVNNRTLNWIKHLYDHDILKNNINNQYKNQNQMHCAFETILDAFEKKSSTMIIKFQKPKIVQYWHEMLTHANHEIIQHLQPAAEKMKIIDSMISKIHECETCALFKIHRIIFCFYVHKKISILSNYI